MLPYKVHYNIIFGIFMLYALSKSKMVAKTISGCGFDHIF